MTNDEDYKEYFDTEASGTGPTHEVSPRKSKTPVTEKAADAMPR